MTPEPFEIRAATTADHPQIMGLLRDSLGWEADARHEALFRWKHEQNAFGASPAWVAVAGTRVVGFRTFMRWQFDDGDGVVRSVRAVDTATAPDFRGRGVFTALTRHALAQLESEAAFVFNTPNEASRPGYEQLGWRPVGRQPVRIRPLSVRGLLRAGRARTPAELWSEPGAAGTPAADALADDAGLAALLAARPGPAAGYRTHLTVDVLRWRYGHPLLGYWAVLAEGGIREGIALGRVRRRGPAREAALCCVLAPDRPSRRALVRRAIATVDADYVLAAGPPPGGRGFVPVPRAGPQLVWRGLRDSRPPPAWALELGDLELF